MITQIRKANGETYKEYYCDVTVCWSGNNYEAKNKEEYVQSVKECFLEEYGIVLTDKEISNIKEGNYYD